MPKPIPRFLYHGTSGRWLRNILRAGIEPRGDRKARNNWTHVAHQSNRRCVYLTDSYAPYFAHNAVGGDGIDKDEDAAIIEIAVDRLDDRNLYPDEDFLEQASRDDPDGPKGTLSQRTLHYRKRQFEYDFSWPCVNPKTGEEMTWWGASVEYLGTCSHRGTIPVEAITRVVTYPYKANLCLAFVFDPTICMLNQAILGASYQALTAKMFAGEFTNPADMPTPRRFEDAFLPPIKGWRVQELRP